MREIKFRAWDKKCKQWANLNQLSDWKTCEVTAVVGMGNDTYPYQTFIVRSDERFEIMQYTGIKDKNWKDVYEGDVVQDWEGIKRGRVVWNDEWACFETTARFIEMNEEMEVIGNIYENPGLI